MEPLARVLILALALTTGAALAGCSSAAERYEAGVGHLALEDDARDAPRPATWAQPLDVPGLPNLHRVSPALYRGAQPAGAGWAGLERLGIRTVLSLRGLHADVIPAGVALDARRIPCDTWDLETEDALRFLALVTDPGAQPVFVHCQHGADRTGTMIAIHRIVVEGWSKDEALREMVGGGYGFHSLWGNLVELVERLDVEALRARLDEQRARATLR